MEELSVYDSNGMKILRSTNVLMLDWDMSKNHAEGSTSVDYPQTVTITAREDVFSHIARYSQYLPIDNVGIRLYWTPNGVRGFITSHLIPASDHRADGILATLRTDKAYRQVVKDRNVYHARVSKKVGRENDFVAAYWTSIGNPNILPEVLKYLKIHDALCKANRESVPTVPNPLAPTSTLEALMRSVEEEPWDETNRGALSDFEQEFLHLLENF